MQGFAPKLAEGEIASLSGAGDDARYFQVNVPVLPGNSGGLLPENVNDAVKISFLLGFLESVPEVSAKLKEPRTAERKFVEVVKDAEQAVVLALVY